MSCTLHRLVEGFGVEGVLVEMVLVLRKCNMKSS